MMQSARPPQEGHASWMIDGWKIGDLNEAMASPGLQIRREWSQIGLVALPKTWPLHQWTLYFVLERAWLMKPNRPCHASIVSSYINHLLAAALNAPRRKKSTPSVNLRLSGIALTLHNRVYELECNYGYWDQPQIATSELLIYKLF